MISYNFWSLGSIFQEMETHLLSRHYTHGRGEGRRERGYEQCKGWQEGWMSAAWEWISWGRRCPRKPALQGQHRETSMGKQQRVKTGSLLPLSKLSRFGFTDLKAEGIAAVPEPESAEIPLFATKPSRINKIN